MSSLERRLARFVRIAAPLAGVGILVLTLPYLSSPRESLLPSGFHLPGMALEFAETSHDVGVALSPARQPIGRARISLILDTYFVIPLYVSLLVALGFVAGSTTTRWSRVLSVLILGASVGAGAFDWLENQHIKMVFTALDSGTFNETVLAGLSLAASCKWFLIGIALVLIAGRLFVVSGSAIVAAAFALAGLLLAGGALASRPLVEWGFVGMGVALLLALTGVHRPPADASSADNALAPERATAAKEQKGWLALVSSVGEAIFNVARAATALIIFVILCWFVGVEARRPVVLIEPLAVPEDLEKLGYSGEVLARWLAERVQEINRKASTPMRRREFVLHEDDGTASVPIPGIGTTVQSVLSPLRSLFGTPQDRVTGDIVVTEKKGEVVKVRLQMHVRGKPRVTVDGDAKELPKLFEEAGEVVVRRMQPYVLASYLCPEGGSDECQQILDEALNAGDAEEQVRALSLRGLIFAYQGQPSKATELYQHATELDPTFAFPWYGRGNDLFDLRRDEEAIAKYQHAIELDPKFAPPWTGWGNALLHLQRDEEAIAKYQHAIELDPKDAIPWSNWGIALVHLQRDDEAIPKSEHAAELDPKLPNPWFWWGEALVDLHRDKEASAKYQHATELDPKFAPAWHAQVRVLERLGRREKAEHVRARAAESGVQVPTDSE